MVTTSFAYIYFNVNVSLVYLFIDWFFSEYFKNGHTLYLNSGLSSSRNHYGQRVITREADLVTAHEFGHNWGSEHDPDRPECSPSASQGGSYLMYTYSVSGYDINNKVREQSKNLKNKVSVYVWKEKYNSYILKDLI